MTSLKIKTMNISVPPINTYLSKQHKYPFTADGVWAGERSVPDWGLDGNLTIFDSIVQDRKYTYYVTLKCFQIIFIWPCFLLRYLDLLYKKLPFIINTNTSVLLCPINVWLHVSTKYIVTFRAIEQHKIQNHNCEHLLRVRVKFESYCYTMHIKKYIKT
jgi:hypothetical protein